MTSPDLPGSSSFACKNPDDAPDSMDWTPASSRTRKTPFSPAHLSTPNQPRSRQPPALSPINSPPPAPCRSPDDQVVIFSPISDASFTHSSPASRARALDSLVKGILEARLLRSGQLVVTVSSPALADVLLCVKNLDGVPVEARRPARYLSSHTGVIVGVPLCVSEEDLADALSSTASSFTRLLRRDPSGSWIPSTSVKAQFITSVPSSVAISYHVFHVRPFIPNPIQCRNCQRYGHTSHNCRSPVRCGQCAGPHSSSDCSSSSPRICALCKGSHSVWDRDCPHRRRAREIERLQVVHRLTLQEALRRVPLPSTHSDKPLAPAHSLDSSTQTSPVLYSDADSNTDLPTARNLSVRLHLLALMRQRPPVLLACTPSLQAPVQNTFPFLMDPVLSSFPPVLFITSSPLTSMPASHLPAWNPPSETTSSPAATKRMMMMTALMILMIS